MPLYFPALTVEEEDAGPSVVGVRKIQFPNTSVTNDGGGVVSVAGASVTEIEDLPTAETDDTLVLSPDGGGGVEWRAESGGLGAPDSDRVVLTSADYTGTAGSFADVTGATLTITTAARRCLVGVTCTAQAATNGDGLHLDIEIDGVRQGGTNGLTGHRFPSSSSRADLSFVYMTDVLSAGSHTFDLQSFRSPGSGTITIFASSSQAPLTFWVQEQLA